MHHLLCQSFVPLGYLAVRVMRENAFALGADFRSTDGTGNHLIIDLDLPAVGVTDQGSNFLGIIGSGIHHGEEDTFDSQLRIDLSADLIDGASTYIGWIFAGIPFVFLYNMVSAIMRALGDSKTPLYFLVLTSAVNIVLDLVLIIKFNMGVLGAAVATDVSQAISGVISLIYLIKKFKILHMTRDEWKYSRSTCRRLSAMGLPMGLQCTITAVGGVIMQWAVNGLGSSVVAAITAAGKTQNLLSCALESIGTAMATYAGQNLGAARLDRVRSGVKSSYIMVVAYSVLAFIALHFGDVVIIGLFLDTKTEVEIVAMARDYMFWNSLFFIPLGALIVWRYTIQGLGYSTLAMMAGVAEMVARTVIGLVLIPVLGYFGAELSNPVAWVAACLFLYPAYLWTVKHLENRLLAGHLAMQHSAVGD